MENPRSARGLSRTAITNRTTHPSPGVHRYAERVNPVRPVRVRPYRFGSCAIAGRSQPGANANDCDPCHRSGPNLSESVEGLSRALVWRGRLDRFSRSRSHPRLNRPGSTRRAHRDTPTFRRRDSVAGARAAARVCRSHPHRGNAPPVGATLASDLDRCRRPPATRHPNFVKMTDAPILADGYHPATPGRVGWRGT